MTEDDIDPHAPCLKDDVRMRMTNATQHAFLVALRQNHNANVNLFGGEDGRCDVSPIIVGAYASLLQFMLESGYPEPHVRTWLGEMTDELMPLVAQAVMLQSGVQGSC